MRLPAEWEPHERTLMGWPCRRELWGAAMEQACADYATVANAIAAFEPVTMIANAGPDAAAARAACGAGVEVVELPLDDSWLRDCGPIYVYGEDGRRRAVHFGFNAWGGKFDPYDRDAAVGGLIAERLGDPVVRAPLVLEGGSIVGDGAGTLLTTEECLLNPNRNPGLGREEIEAGLIEHLGVDRVVWLEYGMVEDKDTDGHVDLIASFTAPGAAIVLSPGPENPNHERAQRQPGAIARCRDRCPGVTVPRLCRGRGHDDRGELSQLLHLQRRGDRSRVWRRDRSRGAGAHRPRVSGPGGRARPRRRPRLRWRGSALHHPAGPGARCPLSS